MINKKLRARYIRDNTMQKKPIEEVQKMQVEIQKQKDDIQQKLCSPIKKKGFEVIKSHASQSKN